MDLMIDLVSFLIAVLPMYAGGVLIVLVLMIWMVYRIVCFVWFPHREDDPLRPQFFCEKCGCEIRTFSSRCRQCGSMNWKTILSRLAIIIVIYIALVMMWTGFFSRYFLTELILPIDAIIGA